MLAYSIPVCHKDKSQTSGELAILVLYIKEMMPQTLITIDLLLSLIQTIKLSLTLSASGWGNLWNR